MLEETIAGTEGVKGYLRTYSNEVFADRDMEDVLQQRAFLAAERLIEGIQVTNGVSVLVDELTRKFISKLHKTPEVTELTAEISNSLVTDLTEKTRQSGDVRSMLLHAEQRQYVQSGGFAGDLVVSNTILLNTASATRFLNEAYSCEPNEQLVALVEDTVAQAGELPPEGSYVLLKKDEDGNRYAMGVQRNEKGELIRVGVSSITAQCRMNCFDRLSGSERVNDLGDGLELLVVKEKFENHPEGITNPHVYPDDLFMLKSAAYWSTIEITDSKLVANSLSESKT